MALEKTWRWVDEEWQYRAFGLHEI